MAREVRTSITHPLRIASLAPGEAAWGLVGITFCPGKVDPDGLSAAWQRDLEADLDAIAGWPAALVVTLIEEHEFGLLGVPQLGGRILARGLAWIHAPIEDVSVPDRAFEAAWETHGRQVRQTLRSGGNVLFHCRGGLGRAGMMTARTLVELGWQPERAIREVRRIRPGAIETRPQERVVLLARERDD